MLMMMMMMIYPTIHNYYIRDDGLMILIESVDASVFQFKVILGVGFYAIGSQEYEINSNICEYREIDYHIGNRFDKLITS